MLNIVAVSLMYTATLLRTMGKYENNVHMSLDKSIRQQVYFRETVYGQYSKYFTDL